jgi:hypothetical protein
MRDRWRGFVAGLKQREFDHFTDHSVMRYVECILRAVKEEEAIALRLIPFERSVIAPQRRAA